jgi:glycosyltransferase involved in cell wall biosynthesis
MQFLILGVGLMGIIESENATPRVTVLIPCNSTNFLAECLNSVACQDYLNIDVLIVLNGKAIHERNALVQEFTEYPRNIKFVLSEKEGIVSALNLGLELSSNEFIARIDADDVMPSNRITLQVAKFTHDSEIVCVGGQLEYLAATLKQKHPGYPLTDEGFRHALYRFSPLPHPGIMYKKSAVKQAGMYREKYPYIEDWDLWIRLSEQGKIVNLPETTVFYRIHSNQSTNLHAAVQQVSIKALSAEMLRRTITGPNPQGTRWSHYSEPNSVVKFFKIIFSAKKPFTKEGVLGQKAKRRGLAGYFYIHSINSRTSKTKLVFIYILISFIDPLILIRKFTQGVIHSSINS